MDSKAGKRDVTLSPTITATSNASSPSGPPTTAAGIKGTCSSNSSLVHSSCCLICQLTPFEVFKIVGFTMIPFGVTAAGVYLWSSKRADKKKRGIEIYQNVSKPRWSIFNTKIAACIDLLTVAPIGTALFLVTKKGFSQQHVPCSIGMFATLMVSNVYSVYAFFRQKKLKHVFCAALMISLSSTAASFCFGKINRWAGFLLLPCALWSIYQTAEVGYAYRKEKPAITGKSS